VAALHRGLSVREGRGTDLVWEAAGDDYELPNASAYNETCAQIGNVLWTWRLLAAEPAARYADLIEWSLFNSILSGISLRGDAWFYTNPLRWHGREQVLHSNDALERFQPGDPAAGRRHVCCPSNLVRLVAGLHGYAYGVSVEGLWLHLYGASTFDGELPGGGRLRLRQETAYPWEGAIRLTVEAAPAAPTTLRLRVPAWCGGATLRVNGGPAQRPAPGEYAALRRAWRAGDVVDLDLPLPVRLLEADPRVESARGQVAAARGPLLYCLEGFDLPDGVRLDDVSLAPDAGLRPRHVPDLLGGVTVLEGEADVWRGPSWDGALYRTVRARQSGRGPLRLIPYFAWANRGVCEMSVWLPVSPRGPEPERP
jgi:DUF1680 family protein